MIHFSGEFPGQLRQWFEDEVFNADLGPIACLKEQKRLFEQVVAVIMLIVIAAVAIIITYRGTL